MEELPIVRTKHGASAYWQFIDRFSDSVYAVFVCGPRGEKPVSVRVEKIKYPFPVRHVLSLIDVDYHILFVTRKKEGISIVIYRIFKIYGKVAKVTTVVQLSQGKWDRQPPEYLTGVIETAIQKVNEFFEKIQNKQL